MSQNTRLELLSEFRKNRTITIKPERIAELRQMPYSEYLQTLEWKRRRQQAIEIADHRCAVCYSPKRLHVHHRTYQNVGDEKQSDLTVLCSECHDLFHRHRRLHMEVPA